MDCQHCKKLQVLSIKQPREKYTNLPEYIKDKLSMFVPSNAIPAEVTMLMMSFLALLSAVSAVRQKTPKVNNTTLSYNF